MIRDFLYNPCLPRAHLVSHRTAREMVKESQRNAMRKNPTREVHRLSWNWWHAYTVKLTRGHDEWSCGSSRVSGPELRAVYSSRHFYVLFIGVLPLTALYHRLDRKRACFLPGLCRSRSCAVNWKSPRWPKMFLNHILFCRFWLQCSRIHEAS